MIEIEQLSKKLKQIQKEITDFQSQCQHKSQQIKFDDKNTANWFCKDCNKLIRIPTPAELQDWIDS